MDIWQLKGLISKYLQLQRIQCIMIKLRYDNDVELNGESPLERREGWLQSFILANCLNLKE